MNKKQFIFDPVGTDEDCLSDLDKSLSLIFNSEMNDIVLVFNCEERMFSLPTLLKIKPILDKYRVSVKEKQKCTYIILTDPLKKILIQTALAIIGTDRPFYIIPDKESIPIE